MANFKGTVSGLALGLVLGLVGGAELWWETVFKTLSGQLPVLALDYKNDRYAADTGSGLEEKTFSELHTFSRASNATYVDSDGFLQIAASGEYRIGPNGLMLEGAATNIAIQSNAFDTTWGMGAGLATPVRSIQGPDGVSDSGWLLIDLNDQGFGFQFLHMSVTLEVSKQYVWSTWAKKGQNDYLILYPSGFSTPVEGSKVSFNLNTGTVGTINGFAEAGMEDWGNGWYRCWAVFTSDASDTTGSARLYVSNTDNNIIGATRNGDQSIYVFGHQLERGSRPSSYIPTTTVPVTRLAETTNLAISSFAYNNGAANTVFIDFKTSPGDQTSEVFFQVSDGSTLNHIMLSESSGAFRTAITGGTAGVTTLGSVIPETDFKLAAGFSTNDFTSTLDGVHSSTDTTVTVPTVNTVSIGYRGSNNDRWFGGDVRGFAIYASNLSDTDRAGITT